MMLLISYDINRPRKRGVYSRLSREIEKARKSCKILESTWIISTKYEPDIWACRLRRHIDENDVLLIIEVCENYDGQLPDDAWECLDEGDFRC